jgi:hypothetical protein
MARKLTHYRETVGWVATRRIHLRLFPLGLDLQCAYSKFSAMVMELCWIP